jgi:hypothetical protein
MILFSSILIELNITAVAYLQAILTIKLMLFKSYFVFDWRNLGLGGFNEINAPIMSFFSIMFEY